jgi:hypothetical protein
MQLPALIDRLEPGPISDAIRLPTAEALVQRVTEQPQLKGPILRALACYQGLSAVKLLEIAGQEGEKLSAANGSAKRRAVEAALNVTHAGMRGVALEGESPAGADPSSYSELGRTKMPPAAAVEALRTGTITPEIVRDVFDSSSAFRVRAQQAVHEKRMSTAFSERELLAQRRKALLEGGGLRFDQFVEMHQFGSNGFYSEQLDIASELGQIAVATPMALDESYRKKVTSDIFKITLGYVLAAKQLGRDFKAEPLVFAELGGGAGDFKSAFLDFYDHAVGHGWDVPLNYISVDINHFQRLSQVVAGTTVQAGTAIQTGLADESIDILFNEEVPDCFPHRWFKWNKDLGALTHEAYVVAGEELFDLVFREVERTPEVESIEQHLRQIGYDIPHYRFSAMDKQFWTEAHRVLRTYGFNMFIDYTLRGMWQSRGDQTTVMEAAINLAYNDITRGIDPLWMKRVAQELNFSVNARVCPPRPELPSEERVLVYSSKDAPFAGPDGAAENSPAPADFPAKPT